MKNKIIFSLLTALLFLAGILFFLQYSKPTSYQPPISKDQQSTSLVKASTYEEPVTTLEQMQRRVSLSGHFSKDESKVYWWHLEILDADVHSFNTYDDRYAYDKNRVYYQGFPLDGDRENLFIIQGADRATFTSLGNGYAKDKNHAYYKGGEIVGADSATFELLGLVGTTLYAKDKDQVYFQNKTIDGFDAQTFHILPKSRLFSVFMADKSKVAMGKLSETVSEDGEYKFEVDTIDKADPHSFTVLDELWGKDTEHVFYGTQVVAEADPETFQVLGTDDGDYPKMLYAKDRNHVYYFGKRVEGADPASFETVGNITLAAGNFGEDIHSAYKDGEVLSKQDLHSFQRNKIPSSAKNLGSNYYLYRDNIYHYSPPGQAGAYFGLIYSQYQPEQILADPATFQVLKDGYARDKNYVYYEGSKFADDPDQSFVLLKPPYSKTNQKVFLNNNGVDGALPDSFEILSLGYAKDAEAVFYGDKKVTGADPATFKVIGEGLSSEIDDWSGERIYYNYARDAKSVFCEEYKLTDADPETFILKGKNGMPQDKFRYYDGCEVKE